MKHYDVLLNQPKMFSLEYFNPKKFISKLKHHKVTETVSWSYNIMVIIMNLIMCVYVRRYKY